jgi:hypothetical protein
MISLTSQVHYDVVPQSLSREQVEVGICREQRIS